MTLRNIIKNTLKRSESTVACFHKLDTRSRIVLYNISPMLLYKILFRRSKGRWPELEKPKSFDEKLAWLMLYWNHPSRVQCADKYAMRSYVEEHGFGHILPQLLGVYENSTEINFDALPQRFVLKCTHGCGFNIICKDRNKLNYEETKRKLDTWMKTDFNKIYGEIHYAFIKPRIICECFLGDSDGNLPNDYKVFCFDGKAHCIMACTERGSSSDGRDAKYDIYDLGWKNKLPYSKSSLLANRNIPKPEAYEEIIQAAEKLSKPFPFVRMDFYSIDGKALLGEMTFTPAGCKDSYITDLGQQVLGKLIKLPEKHLE